MSNRKLDLRQQTFGFPDEELKTSLHDQIVLWVKGNAAEICRKLIGWKETWDPELIESDKQRAAATVATRVDLLREALANDKSKLDRISRGQCRFYNAEDVEKRIKAMEAELAFLDSWAGLGEPPAPKLDVRCELEHVILRSRHETNLRIHGYADVVLSVRKLKLCAGNAPSNDYGRPYLGVDPRGYANWSVTWSDFRRFAFDAKNDIRSLGVLLRQFKTYQIYSNLPFYVVSPDSRFAEEISDEGFGFIKYPEAIITSPKLSIHR
jgi:hypothetical protein